MKLGRTLTISGKVLRSLRHDRRTVAFLLLMPLLMIAIFGYAFGGTVKNIPVIIVDLDQGISNVSVSADIIEEMGTKDTFKAVETIGRSFQGDAIAYARDRIARGEVRGAIIFGPDLTANALSAGPQGPVANLTVLLDGSNSNVAAAITGEVQRAIQTVLAQKYHFSSPLTLTVDKVYGQDAQFLDSFAPGVMGLAVMMITFMLSIITFVHERATGTLDRLRTTPVRESEIVIGHTIALGLVALIQSSVVLSAAVLLFKIHIVGNVLIVLLLLVLLGTGMQGLGFLLSSNAKNEFQAIQFIPLILFPSILLAGVFWPLEAIPDFLQPISYFIPLTYAVDGARSVMIRGWGLEGIWPQIVVLLAFSVAMLVLSIISLRRRG